MLRDTAFRRPSISREVEETVESRSLHYVGNMVLFPAGTLIIAALRFPGEAQMLLNEK